MSYFQYKKKVWRKNHVLPKVSVIHLRRGQTVLLGGRKFKSMDEDFSRNNDFGYAPKINIINPKNSHNF